MNEYIVGERAADGSILIMLNVEDIFPFFSNPVKWCEDRKTDAVQATSRKRG